MSKTRIPEELIPQLTHLHECVLRITGLPMIVNKSRKREFVDARRVFAHLALKYCTYTKTELYRKPYKRAITYPQLGLYLERDHSTIHSNNDELETLMRYNHQLDRLYTSVEELFTRPLAKSESY